MIASKTSNRDGRVMFQWVVSSLIPCFLLALAVVVIAKFGSPAYDGSQNWP